MQIEQCLAGSGLTLSQLADPACEIATSQELLLIGNLVTALGHIPDLGLLVGQRYHLCTYASGVSPYSAVRLCAAPPAWACATSI